MTHRKATTIVIPIRDASSTFREPTLEEILSDSIVEAVMKADAVDLGELRALPVCTENLSPNILVMKPAKDWV